MLVLSRKNEQAVIIGESGHFKNIVKVTVLEISRGNVTLGFEANENVVIHREEVWKGIFGRPQGDQPIRGPERKISKNGNGRARLYSEPGKGMSRVQSTDRQTLSMSESGGDAVRQISE
jgi:carbon storage regulator CsrA